MARRELKVGELHIRDLVGSTPIREIVVIVNGFNIGYREYWLDARKGRIEHNQDFRVLFCADHGFKRWSKGLISEQELLLSYGFNLEEIRMQASKVDEERSLTHILDILPQIPEPLLIKELESRGRKVK